MLKISYDEDTAKLVKHWAKRRKLDKEVDAERLLLRVGLARVSGMARYTEGKNPIAKFTVRGKLGKAMSEEDTNKLDAEMLTALDSYAEARELKRSEAASIVMTSGANRLQALANYEARPRDGEGHVKSRKTDGGNKPGWLKRKARRDGSPAVAKVKKPKPAKKAEAKPKAPRKAKPKAEAAPQPAAE